LKKTLQQAEIFGDKLVPLERKPLLWYFKIDEKDCGL